MEYHLCEAKTAKNLQRAVGSYLGAGWRPIGGVAVAPLQNTSGWWYYQAVVREPNEGRPTTIARAEAAKPAATGLGDFD